MKFLYLLISLTLITSCVDRTFDEPPVKELTIPFIANSSIAELKTRYQAGKFITISDDINIIGIVIADDKSGNFYKSLVVQDSTGGIIVKVNRIGLFATYSQGSKIGIKCKGLTIGDYGGLIQLGEGSSITNGKEQLDFIPDLDAKNYLFQGAKNQIVTPKKIVINGVRSSDLSTLVQLDSVEFSRADILKTIANPGGASFRDVTLSDCNKSTILLHTSDFADFASYLCSSNNGSIIGVLGKFNSSIQLYLRDTNEIKFNNTPCLGGGGTGNATLITIKELRSIYLGAATVIDKSYKIKGLVISDKDALNVNKQNLFIQDLSGGIAIRFVSAHNFGINQVIEVDVSNQELSEFNGLLQINNLALANASGLQEQLTIAAKIVSIADLNSDFKNYESTLVQIKNIKLTKASDAIFEFNVVAKDLSGMINLFTSTTASFAKMNFPTDIIDINVIASEFNGHQVLLRNLNDITIVGGGSGAQLKSIADIRSIYQGATTNILEDCYIRGTVSSEKNALNIVTQNLVLQDQSAGITVRFTGNHNFELGDIINVKLKSMELFEFNGLLELNNIPLSNATFVSSGNAITPKLKTIQEILTNLEALEGQLVEIKGVTISKSSGGTYSGTCVIADSSGSMDLFTRTQSSFASFNFPTTPVKLTGIVSEFTKAQIIMRTINDVMP